MKRRDDALREERKMQDKLAEMVKAKESELVQVQVRPVPAVEVRRQGLVPHWPWTPRVVSVVRRSVGR